MKDPMHHMTKFLKKIKKKVSSEPVKEPEVKKEYEKPKSEEQKRKQKKIKIRKRRENHIPSNPTPEERNREMNDRVPMKKERSHKAVVQKIAPDKKPEKIKPPKVTKK